MGEQAIRGTYALIESKSSHPKVYKNSFRLMCDNIGLEIINLFGELPVIDLMYEFIHVDDLLKDIMAKNESYYHVYLLQKK